ncbi:NAD(P)-dependent dehydrogenase (short-subunit alcohol dehydrogenase family) [Spinactinospora alkalitolerans]|uniref:NAD(P)-dependent dehydrogenase (Short-subunit alcohol dehydrogenase family) n=1 Tax=Spinactinospora alkalitolerans TaxID=687207 RepID=A0A852TMU9_9ACTN|nr:SDR family oxidoreductase [Spinactinospora alkalitolerans]NYE45258.1 NAD(P)-dependent dehydrogenase (short-subunit alcohol dehydrogenase family) [Spinactinospora alkalitolerans]
MSRLPPRRTPIAEAVGGPGGVPPDPIPGHVGRGLLRGRRALVVGGFGDSSRQGTTVAAALAKEGAAVAVAGSADRTAPAPGAWPLTSHLDTGGRAVVPAQGPGRPGGAPSGAHPDGPVLAAARLVTGLGARALPIHCDLADESGCRGAVAHTALEFGGVDLLVMCGDDEPVGDGLMDITTARLDHTFRATVYSALWLVQAARVFMPADSAVILTAAGTGRPGSPEAMDHAAGTAGVMRLTRSLAEELENRGIRVNCAVSDDRDDPHEVAAAYVRLAGAGTGEVLPVPEALRARL